MDVYLVDGTYELFRHYFALPQAFDSNGQEIAALRGVLISVLSMLEKGCTHVAVATDHVVESFRNGLYANYKTGEGVAEDLMSQFVPLEEALKSMGVLVWPMVEYEADDALASAACIAAKDPAVDRVIICTPDKDLGQSVVGAKVVQLDRRRNIIRDEDGVISKFGVKPKSIPDYLAAVGDSADGYPGLPGWGAKAAASVFSVYEHFEAIPQNPRDWNPSIKSAAKLSKVLTDNWDDAILFRTLATLRSDLPLFQHVDELRWTGPQATFEADCKRMKAEDLFKRVMLLSTSVKKEMELMKS